MVVRPVAPEGRVLIQCPQCKNFRALSPLSILHNSQQYQDGKGICGKCSYKLRLAGMGPIIRRGQDTTRMHTQRVRPAEKPTMALPGTEEKIRVLCRRYETNQELYHPEDAGVVAITRKELLWIHEVALVTIEEQQRLRGLSPLLVDIPIPDDDEED